MKAKLSLFAKTSIIPAILLSVVGCNDAVTATTQNDTSESITESKNYGNLVEGIDFIKLSKPIEGVSYNDITELFWYGCGHCLNVEMHLVDTIAEQSKLNGWSFNKVHYPSERNTWAFDFNIYAALEQLDVGKEVGRDYMLSVQKQGLDRFNEEEMTDFFSKYYLDYELVKEKMNSAERDEIWAHAMKFKVPEVEGTPTFIVGGRYIVKISPKMVGSIKQLISN
ncbi:hypothetical protein L1267_17085 [Pseudoalteromonas sp. OFAV1]|jgi:thiol:disulfide interchange protein DsbA|uniref:hypothetical protein n=1 Tax=Pseudoalteromonas sp. OFAV1 TaxID=2908892 RepID=UPI001F2E32EC|nr:hypothetical protein [Pseudoalteromonas sp. OFAV1]MCF2902093.1 hypothetical protein [Pseudoalteromonas sp. OFAV1]